jgi:hypothetical protein
MTPAYGILDQDNDSMSDIWEAQWGFLIGLSAPANQVPAADPDGDGQTNLQESIAGTNPLSTNPPSGTHRATYTLSPLSLDLQWQQFIGKEYQVQVSNNLTAGSWVPLASPFTATSATTGTVSIMQSIGTPRNFARISVNDVDPDDDGLSSAEENSVGSNPSSPDSDGDGAGDKDEVIQGSSPTNPSDSGQPPYTCGDV